MQTSAMFKRMPVGAMMVILFSPEVKLKIILVHLLLSNIKQEKSLQKTGCVIVK
jgi:hypothetical protein